MTYPYKPQPFPYAYDALLPVIDAQTGRIHYEKHYFAYVDNLNKTLSVAPDLQQPLPELLVDKQLPESVRTGVRNFGGGVYNHELYWHMLKPQGGVQPTGQLAHQLVQTFGSIEQFKQQLSTAALTVFGSGWGWLCLDAHKKLLLKQTSNQDCPLSDGLYPLMCIDVWEHAYYLHYQNRRADFITAFWQLIDWEFIATRYVQAVVSAKN